MTSSQALKIPKKIRLTKLYADGYKGLNFFECIPEDQKNRGFILTFEREIDNFLQK